MIITIINLILSPFCLIIFFFFTASNQNLFFEKKGTNTQKLKVIPYMIYSLAFVITVLLISYIVSVLFTNQLNIWEIYQPRYYWLSIPCWLITSFTLSVFFKGMEGNIMGFIFFPLLAISSLALLVVNISSIYTFFINIESSVVTINIWFRLFLHAFLPFYILIYVNVPDKKDKKNRFKSPVEPLIGSFLMQLFFFCINWIIVKLWGNGLTFSQFFGQGQSIIYYLPMVAGFLYFIMYLLSKDAFLSKKSYIKNIYLFARVFAVLLMILQFFNYIKLIGQCFK